MKHYFLLRICERKQKSSRSNTFANTIMLFIILSWCTNTINCIPPQKIHLCTEMCLFSNDISDYHYVAQGKTEIPGVDDGEEARLTDVSAIRLDLNQHLKIEAADIIWVESF